MKGLKSKILIAVIMILSLVLGYQASVMAVGEGYSRTSNSVPFWSGNYLILCREHTNGWKGCWYYTCTEERSLNDAPGMAYFLHYANKGGKGYNNEIQSWIWARCAQYNGGYILNADPESSNYRAMFAGANPNINTIEQFLTSNNNFENIDENQTDEITVSMEQILNGDFKSENGIIPLPIVDEVPYEFFVTSAGSTDNYPKTDENGDVVTDENGNVVEDDEAKDADKRIKDISFEEYNYLYQFYWILNYVKGNSGVSANTLGSHISNYVSEDAMTVYKGSLNNFVTNNNNLKTDDYGRPIDAYGRLIQVKVKDNNNDGTIDERIWTYVNENGNSIDGKWYHNDAAYGTTKFSNRVRLGNNNMLQNYINLYNGTYSIENLASALESYEEKPEGQDGNNNEDAIRTIVQFDNLAKILRDKCKDESGNYLKGAELEKKIGSLLNGYKKQLNEVAKGNTYTKTPSVSLTYENGIATQYVFSGSTSQAARVYQFLVDNNMFKQCIDKFGVYSNAAKVSVDQTNKEYIVGPFVANYFTIKLQNNVLLDLQKFDIVLQINGKEIVLTKNEDGKNVFIFNGEETEFDPSSKPFELITSGNKTKPASGEAFYIRLTQEALREILQVVDSDRLNPKNPKDFLTVNDRLGARVTYKYLKSVTGTIHFLDGYNGRNDNRTTFNTAHPQRLMTFDTKDEWAYASKSAYAIPEYHSFMIEKVASSNENLSLPGAQFAIYGRYKADDGTEKYVELDAMDDGKEGISILDGKCSEALYIDEEEKVYYKNQGINIGNEFEVLNNIDSMLYETNGWGEIYIPYVEEKISIDNKTYSLVSLVCKETKAPENVAEISKLHFEIPKSQGIVAVAKIKNTTITDYKIKIKKVDDSGKPVPGLTLKVNLFDLTKSYTENNQNGYGDRTIEITTGPDGIAILETDLLGDFIGIRIEEKRDASHGSKYQYFKETAILYSAKLDDNGKVQVEFFNYEKNKDSVQNIHFNSPMIVESMLNVIKNGVQRIRTIEGELLYGDEANKYVTCGDKAPAGIDIQIVNKKVKKYNLELLKYDENGKTSEYLNGTKFALTFANMDTNSSVGKSAEVKDGKAIIEDVGVYGDEIKVYVTEIPNSGFKTKLAGHHVMTYSADKDGNVEIKEIDKKLLNPVEGLEIKDDELANVVKNEDGEITATIKLGVINETAPYSLKFRKTDPQGNPLVGATFKLTDKDGNIIDVDTSSKENEGFMTFEGLTQTGDVTLKLYETTAPNGYYSTVTKENPMVITYKYEPGSNLLVGFQIKHGDKIVLLPDDNGEQTLETKDIEIGTDKDGNFGTLNSIFNLVNNANPYDLPLFVKVDNNGNPIPGMKFKVTVSYTGKNGDEISTTRELDSREEDGKLVIPELNVYGKLKITVDELEVKDSASDNYQIITDTLEFSCTTAPGNEPVWSDEVKVVNKDNNTETTYTINGKVLMDENSNKYPYIEIGDNREVKLINNLKPYSIDIKKVNSIDEAPIPGVEFKAVVHKSHTTEKQNFPNEEVGTLSTNSDGILRLDGINIYTTGDEKLSLRITETVPQGYKGYGEYESISYTIDYRKESPDDPIEVIAAVITGRKVDKDGNVIGDMWIDKDAKDIISENAENHSHTVTIKNTPVYDLDLFDKAIVTETELANILDKGEYNFADVLAKGGIEFTAEVRYMNATIQENVKVTFDENGIVAHDIDTSSLFGKNVPQVNGLKLVLTEAKTSNLVEIKPITIVYDCKYDKGKFEPTKVSYQYDENSYSFSATDKNVAIVDKLIYIDKAGNHVLVNTEIEPETAEIILKKFDADGKAINGVRFQGKITSANGEHNFDVTTGEIGVDGEAVISNISLTGAVTLVITDESWKDGKMPEGMNYSELEFIKDDITISGIVINEDEQGNKSADCSNAKVDDAHKDQVKINEATMAIDVTNKKLTYNIPIVKTSEKDVPLNDVVFDFIIKKDGEEDDSADNKAFLAQKTMPIGKDNGRINLTGIDLIGNCVLEIDEVSSKHSNYRMLEGKVWVHYTAEVIRETNKVKITITEIEYEKEKDKDNNKVKVLTDKETDEFIGIQVINEEEYSISLRKVMNINGKPVSPTEEVTFKGVVTTNTDIVEVINKEHNTYDGFGKYLDGLKYNSSNESDDTKYFEVKTKDSLAEIATLDEQEKTVYVYFIEELQESSSMTLIEEVLKVTFNKENASSEVSNNKLSFNEDELDITVEVKNDAKPYQIDFLKVDSSGNGVNSLAQAKFRFILIEIDESSDKIATINQDAVEITFGDDGGISKKERVEGSKEYMNFTLDSENKNKITIDVNKYGKLQLVIEELWAPKYFSTELKPGVITFEATEEGIEILEGITDELNATVSGDKEFKVELKNHEAPYDLPVRKVLKDKVTDKESELVNNIKFDVKFFNTKCEPIMKEWSKTYTTGQDNVAGEFVIEDITTNGTYYMTLKETDAPGEVKMIPETLVFEVKTKTKDIIDNEGNIINGDAIESITYKGTGIIDENGKLSIKGNNDYNEYVKTVTEKGKTEIECLEISNERTSNYSIGVLKYSVDPKDPSKKEPLNGVIFESSLTRKNDASGENLLKSDDIQKTTANGGRISYKELDYFGEYTLTLKEIYWTEKIRQTFDTIVIDYSAENKDGEQSERFKINSVKVYFEGKELDSKDIVSCKTNGNTLEIEIINERANEIPLYIYKTYKEDDSADSKLIPLPKAGFSAIITEVKTGNVFTVSTQETGKDGYLKLGEFPVDGEVKVILTEEYAPSGFGKLPTAEYTLNVNNKEEKIELIAKPSTLENFENNTFTLVDPETVTPYITLSGMVWEEVKQPTKGEDSYQDTDDDKIGLDDKIDFTEGLYDKGDKPLQGIKVHLYQLKDDNAGYEEYTYVNTDKSGNYRFENLNPFKKYFITFEYDGETYETVKYLVKDIYGNQYEGNMSEAIYGTDKNGTNKIDSEILDRNSKAVTDEKQGHREMQSYIATTTKSKEPNTGKNTVNLDAVQLYPVEAQYTIDGNKVTLYEKAGKYYTIQVDGSREVTYLPTQPSHQHINLGLIPRPQFDLNLVKDVQEINAYSSTGASQPFKQGRKPDSQMYTIKLTQADIEKLNKLEIVYKIEVKNEGETSGYLTSITDYFNRDLLEIEAAKFVKDNKEYPISGFKPEEGPSSMIPIQYFENGTLSKNETANTGRVTLKIEDENGNKIPIAPSEEIVIYIVYKYRDESIPLRTKVGVNEVGESVYEAKPIGSEHVTLGLAEIEESVGFKEETEVTDETKILNDKDSIAGNLDEKMRRKILCLC